MFNVVRIMGMKMYTYNMRASFSVRNFGESDDGFQQVK